MFMTCEWLVKSRVQISVDHMEKGWGKKGQTMFGEHDCSFVHAPKKVNRELLHTNVFLTHQKFLKKLKYHEQYAPWMLFNILVGLTLNTQKYTK